MTIDRLKQGVINRTMRFINERRGWKTNRKIIVIESDDWGSIRMPDRDTYERSLKKGIRVDKCSFCKNDTLASTDDFDALYTVLSQYKDSNNNHPVITANTIVGNPNFEKIKKNNYKNYHFEFFTETLKRYPNHSIDLWKQGMDEGLFYPQLHGREHLNIGRWLKLLQNGSKEIHFAFENNFFGISSTISNENNSSLMAAFDYDNEFGKELALESVKQAPDIFEKIFGFKSKSFIGPNYVWDEYVEEILKIKGVEYLQGAFINKTASKNNMYNYIGKINKIGQIYTARNVIFEPSSQTNNDLVGKTIKQIGRTFEFNKPAIFSSHRVNFIGGVFEENRTRNLQLLDELLNQVLKRWPNVEFMHSAQLGNIIKEDLK